MVAEMANDADLDSDLKTMALTVWAEARGESTTGRKAVAWVIRNRFENPGWWSVAGGGIPRHTLEAVCRAPYQFSCWNAKDPNRARLDDPSTLARADYQAIRAVCAAVLAAPIDDDPTKGADHYCTLAVAPKTAWAKGRTPAVVIGHHAFYRLGLGGKRP